MIFHDRRHAGRLLAPKLQKYKPENPIVLALPRGGAPVAAEIASALDTVFDVLIVRKIGAPFHSELAVGAICEEEDPIWNDAILYQLGLEPGDLKTTIDLEREKVKKQTDRFRESRKSISPKGQTVIVTDDGLATGATMVAAIKFLKKKGAAKIVVAVPVAAARSASQLRNKVHEVIALDEREDLISVGQWYDDFSQVTDDEVVELLRQGRENSRSTRSQIGIPLADATLAGELMTFPNMKALIIFVHGSGSSRRSPRNQQVARFLNGKGFGTLLFDLLTEEEARDRKNVFDIDFLSDRLLATIKWLRERTELKEAPFGFFGASTGAGAALRAASELEKGESVFAIVSRGGRPDLAGESLKLIQTPTLLLVGGHDFDVIKLNQQAHDQLARSELSIVAGATHLFEETGALEEVARQAAHWFLDSLPGLDARKQVTRPDRLEEAVAQSLAPLRDEEDLERLVRALKDKRVVMLGESSHGTAEFYEIRSQISKRLLRDYGFKFIAVEGDWPDAARLNRYIQNGEGQNAKAVLRRNHRWPTWMWANEEIAELAEWMKKERAGFYGLDVYSLFESIDEVVGYLKKTNPPLAQEFSRRYACFEPFAGDEISYARSLFQDPAGCQQEVLENLQRLLSLRVEDAATDGNELFSAQQNARIVANAEAYYRAMLGADASSWNVRDAHMMDTLDRLLERAGEGAKALVWAHNTHIGDYRATDMKAAGYVNIGGLARQSYGSDNVALVGFGTYEGEVLAGHAWGAPEESMVLPRARQGSYEEVFHKVSQTKKADRFFLLFDDQSSSLFRQEKGHRAVGVVYDPRHERRGNYVPTELSKRYDAFVFVDKTHALKSLHAAFARGEFPETWPAGE